MLESQAIVQLYKEHLIKDIADSITKLSNVFIKLKTQTIQKMPNRKSEDKINMLCNLLTDVISKNNETAFAHGFLTALKLILEELEKECRYYLTFLYLLKDGKSTMQRKVLEE